MADKEDSKQRRSKYILSLTGGSLECLANSRYQEVFQERLDHFMDEKE